LLIASSKKNGDSIGGGEWQEGRNFWHELRDIFEAIANEYNGHLFEGKPPTSSPAANDGVDYFTPARTLLESVTLPNQAVANAIDRLLRVYQPTDQKKLHPVRVDYSTLRVRELGTIYEGLLEWQLKAITDTQLKIGSVKLLGDRYITRKVVPGDFTLISDQSDRKATGSYYTPHYVVQFIGENILKPILEEIEEDCQSDSSLIISRILELRVLDPAMGSGHFLVFAVEYLAAYVYVQLGKLREQGQGKTNSKRRQKAPVPFTLDASIEFIRARIAERCIYGVDINPLAVELAKLSLWIATAAKGVPLSFLNHHLRCGDTLLGVFSNELHHDLFAQKLVQQMALAVGHIRLVNDLHTETLRDVGKKEEELRVAREHLRRFRLTYDCQLVPLFGADIAGEFHSWLDGIDGPVPDPLPQWLVSVEKIASEFRFFHWELEFPEVWRDRFGRPLDAMRRKATERAPGFDVILGNPPFVTSKSELGRRAYMERWTTAVKGFHLLVPFFERAFQVLRPNGRLGFIVSNGFARREFGKPLVEEFLPSHRLEEIVDSSGLSFPGHGTPTCIIFASAAKEDPATNRVADGCDANDTVRVTATLKGDLHTPPQDSTLWQSTVAHHAEPGFRDEWVSVSDVPRQNFTRHPWNFSEENEGTRRELENAPHTRLGSLLEDEIGYGCITRTDEVFIQPQHVMRRFQIEAEHVRRLGIGERLRDWSRGELPLIIFPYDSALRPFDIVDHPHCAAFLEPYRETLENVIMHGTVPKKETKIQWFEYSRLGRAKMQTARAVAIPEIATHNHAYFDQSAIVFHQTAPVLKLRPAAPDSEHFLVASVLNSSAALFWLKQICFNKGPGEDEEKDRFVYAGRKLEQLPVPNTVIPASSGSVAGRLIGLASECNARAQLLTGLAYHGVFEKAGEAYDAWNRALPGYALPDAIFKQAFDTPQELMKLKATAKEERERLRREMIALQEEMDWLAYAAYGLIQANHESVGLGIMETERPWELALGQRPFELASLQAGAPSDWSRKHKRLWLARLELIRTNEHVARIEQAVYKRRWVPPDYEKEFAEAFKWWLREKAEFMLEHVLHGGPVSLDDWAASLWKDRRVRAAAVVYNDGTVANAKKFEPILKGTVEEETVPDDEAAFKPRHKQLRGGLNVPRERFRSLSSRAGYYTWAGKRG
jgi:Eco57I restriction-modification methylase/uncharacterized protein DUF7008